MLPKSLGLDIIRNSALVQAEKNKAFFLHQTNKLILLSKKTKQ